MLSNCSVFKYALTAAAVVDTYPPGSVGAGGNVWLTKTASQPVIFSHLSALSNCCPQTEAALEAIMAHVFHSDAKKKRKKYKKEQVSFLNIFLLKIVYMAHGFTIKCKECFRKCKRIKK